ncbi:MAG: hotdog fold thioesterase [Saprospiraceae bacterium]|nr:hotdog fold thioesterase [Saprospiraceae bacterium]
MSSIWKNKFTKETFDSICKSTLAEHLEIELVEVGEDYLKLKMPINEKTKQPMGLLHGGASLALSESAGSIASAMCVDNPFNQQPVGVEINGNHLRSATSGYANSVTKPIKIGRTLHVWNTEIFDDEGRLLCTSRLTIMIVKN